MPRRPSSSALPLSLCALLAVVGALAFGCPQPIRTFPDAGSGDAGADGARDGGGRADAGPGEEDAGTPDACVPITCAQAGLACGQMDLGCGQSATCFCGVARSCSASQGQGLCECATSAFQPHLADTGTGNTGLYSSMVVDPAGGVHLAYVDGDQGFKYLYQRPDAASFAPKIEPVEVGIPVTGTALAVDASGGVHVVYYRWTAEGSNIWDAEVWYAHRTPGGTWTRARVETAGVMTYARADYAAIHLDPNGRIHLLYYKFDYFHANLWHAWSDTGSGWVTEEVAAGEDTGNTWTSAGTVTLLADPSGVLHAFYLDYVVHDLRESVRAADGSWSLRPQRVASPSNSGDWTGAWASFQYDAQQVLHATWSLETPTGSSLWHSTRQGEGAWQPEQVDPASGQSGEVGLFNALAIDAEGGLHVAYYDSANKDLKYAYRPPDGTWTVQTAQSTGSVGSYAALALDPAQSLHVAYFERLSVADQTGQLRYATRCR